ncbi:ATP-binding protein [Nocardiopsis sp. CNT312]|uniref:ATP-binding protein n=1 Tax=Nocardiopsis sp. CNT312 TaxID=1137268 RepID=UPI0009DD9EE0|nr:ATP-binding protein [Nocardiopsis sp. CNT312]
MPDFEIPPPRQPQNQGAPVPAALPRRVPGPRPGVRAASFGGTYDQVARVRSWCQQGTRLPAHRMFPVLLVASELVTNAVRHSASGQRCGRVRITAETMPAHIVLLSVTDDGPRPGREATVPALAGDPAGPLSGGRGLHLVAALSERWWWTGFQGGPLTVWALIDPYRDPDT